MGLDLWPTLARFADERHRDRFLAVTDHIKTTTGVEITVEPNCATMSRIRSKGTKLGSPGLDTA